MRLGAILSTRRRLGATGAILGADYRFADAAHVPKLDVVVIRSFVSSAIVRFFTEVLWHLIVKSGEA